MTIVRPIQISEAGRFLELLCGVFELDLARAREVFFQEPLFDIDRKWALFQDGELRSVLTTSPLEFGWGRAVGIAGVATARGYQGQGFGQCLLEHVVAASEAAGEGPALLFAHRQEVYRRVGFEAVDRVVNGDLRPMAERPVALNEPGETRRVYDAWAKDDPARLRRDDRRWRYWNWVYKPCEAFRGGYVCLEGGTVREAVLPAGMPAWPVPEGTRWYGLESMVRALGVPVCRPQGDLLLMARRFPGTPQMFMTDQF